MNSTKRPLSSLLKNVALPPVATSSLTALIVHSFWSEIDETEIASTLSEASTSTLQAASAFTLTDAERVEEAKIRAVQKARTITVALPAALTGSGTLLGCAVSNELSTFNFVRRYRIFRFGFPWFLGVAGTIGGAVVGINLTVAALISVGHKAMLGILLGEFGAPEWLVNFLIS